MITGKTGLLSSGTIMASVLERDRRRPRACRLGV
ncbi:Uncharacterised protein [Bordetella pertussis]|nr:Uncharacterised protein [Bordetella pertussis]CFW41446.1 Uncharacterised protein [Bordetella pertussis]